MRKYLKCSLPQIKQIIPILMFFCNVYSQGVSGYLTNDGAWCWFSDPRAIYTDGNIITGWVKSDGTVEACLFRIVDRSIQTHDLYYKLERDDHNNPAFVKTGDNTILAMYTRHGYKDLFVNKFNCDYNDFVFEGAQLVHPITRKELDKFPKESITYANPFMLTQESNRIYCFGRWTGFKPNLMWSDDNGMSWTKSRVFITSYPFDTNNRPYVKYSSAGRSKIHIVFTDGHPRVEPTNSVYYAYYENGAFYKADSSKLCNIESIPFEPREATVVYKSDVRQGRAWIADIGEDRGGNPVILYTKSPRETEHLYWYARFDGRDWSNNLICNSGRWFPKTPIGKVEPEPHYFGGMTVHPDNANVIYLSRQIKGVFEIERWETNDLGKTWKSAPITKDSNYDNVRPFVPRELKSSNSEIVLWMENLRYVHYTDFKSSIRYHILEK
jgi:hypothetical protein